MTSVEIGQEGAKSVQQQNENQRLLKKEDGAKSTAVLGWHYYVGVTFAVVNAVADVLSVTFIQLIHELPPGFQLNSLR